MGDIYIYKCSSFYFNESLSASQAYHKVMNIIVTLDNFINLKLVRFFFILAQKCKSPCFVPFRFYFLDLTLFL